MQFSGVIISTKLFPPNLILIGGQDVTNWCAHFLLLLLWNKSGFVLAFCNVSLDWWWTWARPCRPNIRKKTVSPQTVIITTRSDTYPGFDGELMISAKLMPSTITDPTMSTGTITFCWASLHKPVASWIQCLYALYACTAQVLGALAVVRRYGITLNN